MSLRTACCALKRSDGTALTPKGTSPVYNDSDAQAMGSMDAKERQAHRQIKAWRANNKLILSAARCFSYDGLVDVGSDVDFARTRQQLLANKREMRVSFEEKLAQTFFWQAAAEAPLHADECGGEESGSDSDFVLV